ncbi:protein NEDD1 [Gastrophryne carolinensis]
MESQGGGRRERLSGVTMDSIRLASAGDDIKIWDSSSMTVVEQFNPHSTSHPVSSLCWSRNNHFLVSASGGGDKIVFSSCKSKPVPLFELAEGKKQTCVKFNSTAQYVVSGGLDNTVNIWDLKSKRLHRSLKDHKDEVTCVTFNNNDSYIASGSMSGEIILHNVTTNLSSTPFGHGSSQPIRHLKYSYVKKFLLGAVSDSGSVTLWDAHSQNPVHMFESAHKAPASGICFSPVNDLLLVTVGLDKRIIFYDVSRKSVLQTVVAESPLTAVDLMPDKTTLAVGSSRGKIYLYDLRVLGPPMKAVSAHKTSVQCIQFQHCSSHRSGRSSGKSSTSSDVGKKPTVAGNSHSAKDLPFSGFAPTQQAMTSDRIQEMDEKFGMPRSTSLDVIPSKETDFSKSSEFKPIDSFGRSSLGDIFSPVREDASYIKVIDEVSSKGNDLDYLAQFTSVPGSRRHPVGASTQGMHSSPIHLIIGSPIKEEEEPQDVEQKSRRSNKTDVKEEIKQPLKPSNSEHISLSNSPIPMSRTPEASERPTLPQLKQDFSMNNTKAATPSKREASRGSQSVLALRVANLERLFGRRAASKATSKRRHLELAYPALAYDDVDDAFDTFDGRVSMEKGPKLPNPVSSDVASSLSEKIADSLACDKMSAPLTSVQINFIRNMIEETLDDFREACHRDIVNLQLEMIKQFHMQSAEIQMLLERYSVNETLVTEIEKLREENKRLRSNY